MSEPNRDKENLVITLKIGVFMAVLGWMVLAIEAPHLTAAPDVNVTPATVAHAAPTPTAPTATDYFPAQYPAPKGEPEPVSPTF
jgi:hypothetical protein